MIHPRRTWLRAGLILAFGIIMTLTMSVSASAVSERDEGDGGIVPVRGISTVLYDGSLGTLPADQGFDYIAFPSGPTQVWSDGGVILDTTGSQGYSAGYFGQAAQVPLLNRSAGFTLSFTARVEAETHSSPDRAGFSVPVPALSGPSHSGSPPAADKRSSPGVGRSRSVPTAQLCRTRCVL